MASSLPPHSSHRRVLMVEDESRLRDVLLRALRAMEFDAEGVGTAEEAIRLFDPDLFGVVIVDLHLPGMGGLELATEIRRRSRDTQIVVLTGHGDLESARQAIKLEAVDFLIKPSSLGELESALDRALRRRLARLIEAPTPLPATIDVVDDLDEGLDRPKRLDEFERDRILETLARHGGRRDLAAAELGISVRTLYYRLAEYERKGYIAR